MGRSLDLPQISGPIPMPARQSVQRVPVIASALRIAKAERTVQKRSQTRFALKIRRDHRTPLSARMCTPMMDGSNSSLQARSPCTTAAALCLPVAILTHLMPRAPKLAHASLHS